MAATFVGGTLATGRRRAGDSDRQDSHVTKCSAHPSVQLAHQRSAPVVGAADRSPAGDHTRRPRPKRTFHMDAGAPIGGQVIENLPEMPNTVELVVEVILIW
jgi:hypothetical protein